MLTIETKEAAFEYTRVACDYASLMQREMTQGGVDADVLNKAYETMIIAAGKVEQLAGTDIVATMDLYRATLN